MINTGRDPVMSTRHIMF